MEMTEESLIRVLTRYNQHHIVNHYLALPPDKRSIFLEEIKELDFDLAFTLYDESKGEEEAQSAGTICQAPIVAIPRTPEEVTRKLEALRLGETLLRDNRVAVLIVCRRPGIKARL